MKLSIHFSYVSVSFIEDEAVLYELLNGQTIESAERIEEKKTAYMDYFDSQVTKIQCANRKLTLSIENMQ